MQGKPSIPLCIINGGADTHEFGIALIPLFEETPDTLKSNIFDDKAARKHGLPIGPHAKKVQERNDQ